MTVCDDDDGIWDTAPHSWKYRHTVTYLTLDPPSALRFARCGCGCFRIECRTHSAAACVDIQPPCQSIGFISTPRCAAKFGGCSHPPPSCLKKGKQKSAPAAAPAALSKAPFPHAPTPTQGFLVAEKVQPLIRLISAGHNQEKQRCRYAFPW